MTAFVKGIFHKDIRTMEFTSGNGDRMLRSGGTLAWLFNNPGNLRPKSKSIYPGQIGIGDTKFGKLCIFASEDAGRAEKRALLRRKYNPMTLRKAIFTYAPPTDNNDSEAYLAFVRKRTGFTDNVVLKDLSDMQLNSLMAAMEQMEGFNAKKDTRKEKWVHVTQVTLSDGARPLANQALVVRRGADLTCANTDAFGRLPPFVTVDAGEQVSLLIKHGNDALETIADFFLQAASSSLLLIRSVEEYKAPLASHNPLPGKKAIQPQPIRYVIQPGDTMSRIAKRFNTDVAKILADNKNTIRDPNKIFPGKVIWLYGKGAVSPATARAVGSMPANGPNKSTASRPERSKEGQGHPLGIINLQSKRAPWMEVAVAQLNLWGGTKEGVIDDTINYHNEIGLGFKNLSTAWCASFVNYCLKSAGFAHTASAGSQSFTHSKNFHKIDLPVYGALAVYANPAKPGQGHVAFVYCNLEGGDIAVLGGNQGDSISFNSHKGIYIDKLKYKFKGYYVPISYKPFAEKQLDAGGDMQAGFYTLATLRSAFGKSSKISVADQNTR